MNPTERKELSDELVANIIKTSAEHGIEIHDTPATRVAIGSAMVAIIPIVATNGLQLGVAAFAKIGMSILGTGLKQHAAAVSGQMTVTE